MADQSQVQWDATPDPAKIAVLTPAQKAASIAESAAANPNQSVQPQQPARKAQPAPPANIKWDAAPDPSKIAALTPTQPATTTDTSDQTHRDPNDIVINDGDSLLTKAAKTVGGLFQGIGQSAIGTVVGSDEWMRKHGPAWMTENMVTGKPADLSKGKELAGNAPGTDHGAAYSPQNIGRVGEDVAEFILGDEALKGSSMSQSLEKALKSVKVIEESPVLTRIIQAGIRGLRGAAVGGAQAGLKTGDPNAVASEALAGGVGNAVVPEVVGGIAKGVKAIIPGSLSKVAEGSTAVTPESMQRLKDMVQESYHSNIRSTVRGAVENALKDVPATDPNAGMYKSYFGEDAPPVTTALPSGVTPSPREFTIPKSSFNEPPVRDVAAQRAADIQAVDTATGRAPEPGASPAKAPAPFQYEEPASMRDVGGTGARTVLKSASNDFQTLDQASGGRWQRFNDAIENLSDKMAEVNGVDDEAYTKLEGQRGQIEAQQQKMLDTMKAGGQVDPAIADRAQGFYKQGMALQDLNKAIQTSTKRVMGTDGMFKEVTDPKLLAPRLAKLNDVPLSGGPSRLTQAIGEKGGGHLQMMSEWAQASQQVEDLKPSFSTGKTAFNEMKQANTIPSPHIANPNAQTTNWTNFAKQVDALGPDKQQQVFGKDLPKIKQYIQARAALQRMVPFLAKVAGGGAAAEIGWHAIGSVLHNDDQQ